MLFDSHVHLNDSDLFPIAEELIQRAIQAGTTHFHVIGYDVVTNYRAIELANKYPTVYMALGYHPTAAKDILPADLHLLEEQLLHPKCVAIGECGLDYYWDKENEHIQKAVFQFQIELANKTKKPLVIHMRDSAHDTLEMLKKYKHSSTQGIMHCYSGSVEMVRDFLDQNMYISLAGPVTFKNARVPKEVAMHIPMDRFLIETDSPWLAPMPYRGKQNEPSYLPYIAQEIASMRNLSYEEFAQITFENTCRLLKISI
jgi:TatD DNase family protein